MYNTALKHHSDITIILAGVHDMQIIEILAQRIWPVCYRHFLQPEQITHLLERIYSPENLKKEMEAGHHFWIAYADNTAIGFASAYQEDDILWLKKLYVDPAFHRMGLHGC